MMNTSVYRFSTRLLASVMIATLAVSNLPLMPIAEIHASSGAVTTTIGGQTSLPDWDALGVKTQLLRSELLIPSSWGKTTLTIRAPKYVYFNDFDITKQSAEVQPYIESVTHETIGEETVLKYTFVENAPSKMTLDYTISVHYTIADKVNRFDINTTLSDTVNVQQATPVNVVAKLDRDYFIQIEYDTKPQVGTQTIWDVMLFANKHLDFGHNPLGLDNTHIQLPLPDGFVFDPTINDPSIRLENIGGKQVLTIPFMHTDYYRRKVIRLLVGPTVTEGTHIPSQTVEYNYHQANSQYSSTTTLPAIDIQPYVEDIYQGIFLFASKIGTNNQYLGKWFYNNNTNRDWQNPRIELTIPEGVEVTRLGSYNLPHPATLEYHTNQGNTKTIPLVHNMGTHIKNSAELGLTDNEYITSLAVIYDKLPIGTGQAFFHTAAAHNPGSNIDLYGNIRTHLPNGTPITTGDMMTYKLSIQADNVIKTSKEISHNYTTISHLSVAMNSIIHNYKDYYYPGDILHTSFSLQPYAYPYGGILTQYTWNHPQYYMRIPKGLTVDRNASHFASLLGVDPIINFRTASDGATIIHIKYEGLPKDQYGILVNNPTIGGNLVIRIDEDIVLGKYDLFDNHFVAVTTEPYHNEQVIHGWGQRKVADIYDLDNDGDVNEEIMRSNQHRNPTHFNVLLPKVLSVYGNSHSLPDPTKKIYKDSDATTTTNIDPHQTFSYEKALLNGTDAPMTNYTSYIVLPRQGDSEASAYNVYLAGGLSGALPAGTTLEYITSDMSRITTLPELQSVTSTTTLPADLKSVTALKLTLPQVDPYTRLFYTFPLMTDITPDVGATAYVRQYFATMDTALATPILGSSKSAYKVQPYTISGKVFMDRNDDRRAQTGEELSDIALSLKVGDTVITSTTTSTDGSYTFTLPDHTRYYTVVVDTRSYDILPKTATAFDGGSMMDANYTSDPINAGALRASVTDLNVGFYDAALYPPLIVATPTLTISTEFNGTIPILSGTLGGQPINPADVTITPTSPLPTGVRIDGDTLVVDLKLPPGKIEVTYTVCEKARPRNCTTVTTDISVKVPTNTNGNNGHNGSNGNGGGGGGYTIPTNNGGNTNGNNGGNTTPTKVHNSAPTNPYPIPSGHPSGLTSAMDGEFTLSSNGDSTMINTTKLNWKDNFCFSPLKATTFHESVEGGDEKLSGWFMLAHNMLYNYQLTSWSGSASFRPHLELTREEAAKFLVEFANNVLCRKPIKTYDNNFNDLDHANETLRPYIIASYEYGIFQGDEGKIPTTFRPKDVISLDEMMAILIRVTTAKFLDEGIRSTWAMPYKRMLNLLTPNSSLTSVTRGNVAEVLFDLYISNDYELTPNGYVLKK